VAAVGRLTPLALGGAPVASGSAVAPSSRPVYFEETGRAPCPVLARDALKPGAVQAGPLIVESPDTTVVVPPAWRLTVEAGGLIALERAHA
jgi:N-methylhydantoinase A